MWLRNDSVNNRDKCATLNNYFVIYFDLSSWFPISKLQKATKKRAMNVKSFKFDFTIFLFSLLLAKQAKKKASRIRIENEKVSQDAFIVVYSQPSRLISVEFNSLSWDIWNGLSRSSDGAFHSLAFMLVIVFNLNQR